MSVEVFNKLVIFGLIMIVVLIYIFVTLPGSGGKR
jgi:hypothetical protein